MPIRAHHRILRGVAGRRGRPCCPRVTGVGSATRVAPIGRLLRRRSIPVRSLSRSRSRCRCCARITAVSCGILCARMRHLGGLHRRIRCRRVLRGSSGRRRRITGRHHRRCWGVGRLGVGPRGRRRSSWNRRGGGPWARVAARSVGLPGWSVTLGRVGGRRWITCRLGDGRGSRLRGGLWDRTAAGHVRRGGRVAWLSRVNGAPRCLTRCRPRGSRRWGIGVVRRTT